MKLAAMFGSSSGAIGATAVGAVVVVAGAVGFTVFNAEPETPAPVPVAAAEMIPEVAPAPVAEAPPEVGPEATPALEAPHLDLVRVDAEGSAVIAGRTSPDLPIAILLNGEVIAQTRADGAGDFVALLVLEPSDAPRQLSVEARPEGAPVLAGAETILVAPFAAPAVDVAEAQVPEEPAAVEQEDPSAEASAETPSPTLEVARAAEVIEDAPVGAPVIDDPAAEESPVAEIAIATPDATPQLPGPAPEPAPPPVAPGVLAAAPAAPTAPSVTAALSEVAAETRPASLQPARAAAPSVVIASPEGLRVVQGPTPEPAVQTSVRLDAISYNAQGAVILAGRGPVAADIQIYLNNQPIQLGEIGPGGDWSLQLPDVDPGTYTLAVAELASDGTTASRVETPFLREDPERVAEAPQQEAAGIDVITVQPGFTLWGIAENTFGEGLLYVQIFEENRDQIRDPNWIFPGQIFRLPDADGLISGN